LGGAKRHAQLQLPFRSLAHHRFGVKRSEPSVPNQALKVKPSRSSIPPFTQTDQLFTTPPNIAVYFLILAILKEQRKHEARDRRSSCQFICRLCEKGEVQSEKPRKSLILD